MTSNKAQRQRPLEENETITTFESWRHNLMYILTLDSNFAPLIKSTWNKASKRDKYRGFTDDTAEEVPDESKRKTAATKVCQLELMLGQIANFAPIISRKSIIERSTSLDNIWQTIRAHYGLQVTGSYFLDFAEISFREGERHEELYQRLMSFVEDNLLEANSVLSHHGDKIDEDEELTPTLENLIVLIWLKLIHKDLPRLVKQKFGTELRSRTLASIKPEISISMSSLLDELNSNSAGRVMRAKSNIPYSKRPNSRNKNRPNRQSSKSCIICELKGKPSDHFLSTCVNLPESDRKYFAKARLVQAIDSAFEDETDQGKSVSFDDDIGSSSSEEEDNSRVGRVCTDETPIINRVKVKRSPWFNVFNNHHAVKITVDTGAVINIVREAVVIALKGKIVKAVQGASQADGKSPLEIVGETTLKFTRNNLEFVLHALVARNVDDDILAGMPFMDDNDLTVNGKCIQFSDKSCFYFSREKEPTSSLVRRAQAHILRSQSVPTTVYPDSFIEVEVPSELAQEKYPIAIEPRPDLAKSEWPSPQLLRVVDGKVRIVNTTGEIQKVTKHEHICQAVRSIKANSKQDPSTIQHSVPTIREVTSKSSLYSQQVTINSEVLGEDVTGKFKSINQEYDHVFSPTFTGYNGAFGKIEGIVNMGPVLPPQRKGRVPQYSRNRLEDLQLKCDELEAMGVLAKPEDVGVTVEYLNPSFLVKKPSGDFRLVTAFSEVAKYAKPQPSLMPNVDNTLRQIAKWKYIIKSDLQKAFYQIPLSKESMKYCGIATPFKGIRVYTRCAMGMPGSETALEELMSRVLGDMIQAGCVAKIADDLYVGSEETNGLAVNWKGVLIQLDLSGLSISAPKTDIAPLSTIVLGWKWQMGALSATSHKISTLATASQPSNVKGLRSFLGAYKYLARVIPQCSAILSPLEECVAGRVSSEKIAWTSELSDHFTKAKSHLQNAKTITIAKQSDKLWVVTDAAQKHAGIGATMFLTRGQNRYLGGYYSAKLHKRQRDWLPCELEALGITAAVSHFSPYIIQSQERATVLTDSKPCVEAFTKMSRGEFSLSARVTTYLSTVSRYQCEVKHLKGSDNTFSDFQSRNAKECHDPSCQICSFVSQMESCVVRSVSVNDILNGSARVPFTSRSAWNSAQEECQDIRQTKAQLRQGTRPSKKVTNKKDVKLYLKSCTLARDGLLIVKRSEPFMPPLECIVIPRSLVNGLTTALHLKFGHPTPHQLKMIMRRNFYAIALDSVIDAVSLNCAECASLRTIPNQLVEQTTESPPYAIGINFASDVLRRERQCILIVREYVTSLLLATIIDNEQKPTLRTALIQLITPIKPIAGPTTVVRVDPAPGFKPLVDDQTLLHHGITIEMGRKKNPNKNPVAERAVQEFEEQLAKSFNNRILTPLEVVLICNSVNEKIRYPGLSSKEMFTKRDQFSNIPLPVDDVELIIRKHKQHTDNHMASARSKAKCPPLPIADIEVGDLVYLNADKEKGKCRERYLVVNVEQDWCNVRKFTDTQLRSMTYRVKKSECFLVPSYRPTNSAQRYDIEVEDEIPATTLEQEQQSRTRADIENLQPALASHANPIVNEPSVVPEVDDSAINTNIVDETTTEQETSEPTASLVEPISSPPSRRSSRQNKGQRPKYLADYKC